MCVCVCMYIHSHKYIHIAYDDIRTLQDFNNLSADFLCLWLPALVSPSSTYIVAMRPFCAPLVNTTVLSGPHHSYVTYREEETNKLLLFPLLMRPLLYASKGNNPS